VTGEETMTAVIMIIGILIALAIASISYFQWQTAQENVLLEIFDRRFAIYESLREAVTEFLQDLDFSNDTHDKYLNAQNQARFYFGEEVDTYLEKLRKDMIGGRFNRYAARPVANSDPQVARLDRIAAFHSEMDRLFIPYMRVDQKMPRWIRHSILTKIQQTARQMFVAH
jgi:hypothetical protein